MTDKTGIRIKAIVLGVLADIGVSLVVGITYGIGLTVCMFIKGIRPEEIGTHLSGPMILIPSLLIGFGATLLGGFVAGRVAKHSEILHGAIVGALGIPLCFLDFGSFPLWFTVVSCVGLAPAGMMGGYLARQKRLRTNNGQPSSPADATRR
ncbi:MAG: hypothetical protein NTY01_11345 [Verrucomicrobia bacterium]|nr:hypothetical protein [Verrucomicrobiota bacterium]